MEMIEKANSGHPGLPMGAAPMAYTLWANHLAIDANHKDWIDRDRFILSAGHGSALLYSLLHLFGYDVSMEDIKNFRQLHSNTAGHPEYNYIEGIEATTGPLGQGIAMAVGMAMAESHMAAEFNKEDLKIIDHYTYVLCGDGDLMEGISQEASSLAGTLALDKLIVLYDSNKISIEGSTDLAFTEDVRKRYEALGWHTLIVDDGNDIEKINKAIEEAKKTNDKPSFIEIKTTIGYGSPSKAGTAGVHGSPLNSDEIKEAKEFLNWTEEESFTVVDDVKEHMEKIKKEKSSIYNSWLEKMKEYKEKYSGEYERLIKWYEGFTIDDMVESNSWLSFEKDLASRAASGLVLNRIAEKVENLFGGSADLAPSNKSEMKDRESYSQDNRTGSNVHFGVREHAMAAIANGLSLHGGLRPYVATFFVFSDYLKPALRLSALMEQPVTYLFTHDSIGVGEDGPTHQPIEQLAMMRATPNVVTFRPADNRETAMGWAVAMEQTARPTALILSRQTLPSIDGTGRDAVKGAYCIKKEAKHLDIIFMATGSELSIAMEAANKLEGEGYGVRVISMPSFELFDEQDQDYKESLLPSTCRNRLAIEAATSFGWSKYIGLDGKTVTIDQFGLSAPGQEVFDELNINAEEVIREAKNVMNQN